jgi:transposase/IS5 family transposase
MSKTFRSWDIDQPLLLPPSVQDLVPAGHLAHFIRDTVREALDLSDIVGEYREERGHPPYHPVMMTALLLYAYCQGIYSSRLIARACEERVDFMAVTAHQRPDFRTVSDFRKRHLKALGALFGQVVLLCGEAGLVNLGHVALDGTKLHANASKHKAMSYGRMKQRVPELAAEIAQWFAQAEATDGAEDAEFGPERRGDELPEWVANKQQRLAKMREAMAALEAEAAPESEDATSEDEPLAGPDSDGASVAKKGSGGRNARPRSKAPPDKAQRNFTDPDSRIMKDSKGFEQAYNAQAAVDADSQVIVAEGLTNAANDGQQVVPMVEEIQRQTGRVPGELSADSGYCSEANLAHLAEHDVRGYIATGRQKHGSASATGKAATRSPHVAAMSTRLKRGGHRSRYRLRKQTVEPVFGQIKSARGFRQFLLRGLEQVSDEWRLVCMAHNLLKLAGARRPTA